MNVALVVLDAIADKVLAYGPSKKTKKSKPTKKRLYGKRQKSK